MTRGTERHDGGENAGAQVLGPLPQPDPALRRLDTLVGTWTITGRTLDAKDDNIRGRVTIEWLPGGFFLQQRGEIEFMGLTIQSLEIVGYDPATNTFPSTVYSNIGGTPRPYRWDVQGDVVTHWTEGAKYTGTFSEDGRLLSGGWRSEAGGEDSAGANYDATMVRTSYRAPEAKSGPSRRTR